MMYTWLNDADAKPRNADIRLVVSGKTPEGKPKYRVVFSNSDMGSVLGGFWGKNRPNMFFPDLVKKVKRKKQKASPTQTVLTKQNDLQKQLISILQLNIGKIGNLG